MSQPRIPDNRRFSGLGFGGFEKIQPGASPGLPLQFGLQRARTSTVQFGLQLPPGLQNGTMKYKAIGEVIWAVEGNRTRRVVTVADGMSITGVADHITIQITDASEPLVEGPLSGFSPYIVNCIMAPGSRSAQQQPPYYEDPDGPYSVAAGASQVVEVPVNIGVISVYVTVATLVAAAPIPSNAVLVQHASAAAGDIWKSYDPREYGWVPISPGSSQIRLLALAGIPTPVLFTVIFGIDG